MKITSTQIFAAAAMFVTTLSPSSGQTTTPPTTTTGNTVQFVTFQSDLSSLSGTTAPTNDRSGSGTAMTTMRLERNSSGKLVRAVVMVQLNSDTSQAES